MERIHPPCYAHPTPVPTMLQGCGNTPSLSHPADLSWRGGPEPGQSPCQQVPPKRGCAAPWWAGASNEVEGPRQGARNTTVSAFPEQLCCVSNNMSKAWCPADVSPISASSFPSPRFPAAILHNITYCSCNISSFPYTLSSLPRPLFPPTPQCSPCLLPNLLGLPAGQESADAGPEVDV